jgi:hypothetical protein
MRHLDVFADTRAELEPLVRTPRRAHSAAHGPRGMNHLTGDVRERGRLLLSRFVGVATRIGG